MNFDFPKFLALVKGGLMNHEATWAAYFEECPDWKQTAITLTAPLLIASSVLSTIFSRLFGTFSQYAYYGNFFTGLVLSLLLGALAVLIASVVFGVLAKVFNGKNDFSRAFAAVSLAAIPAWVATILGSLIPWLGGFVMLAGGIISLVFMYKIMPLALEVPDEKRVVHFISSIVAIIIVNMILGFFIAPKPSFEQLQRQAYEDAGSTSRGSTAPSIVNEFERQGRIMEEASADVFDPPSDGE
jgi:MFS family permease